MESRYTLIEAAAVRAHIEAQQKHGESFTKTVERLAGDWNISRRSLFNYIERGVTARVDKNAQAIMDRLNAPAP